MSHPGSQPPYGPPPEQPRPAARNVLLIVMLVVGLPALLVMTVLITLAAVGGGPASTDREPLAASPQIVEQTAPPSEAASPPSAASTAPANPAGYASIDLGAAKLASCEAQPWGSGIPGYQVIAKGRITNAAEFRGRPLIEVKVDAESGDSLGTAIGGGSLLLDPGQSGDFEATTSLDANPGKIRCEMVRISIHEPR